MIVRPTDDIVAEAKHGRVDRLGVPLEDVHRVDGRGSEVPQSEGCVEGRGDQQLLRRVGTDVGQLLVMTWRNRRYMYTI